METGYTANYIAKCLKRSTCCLSNLLTRFRRISSIVVNIAILTVFEVHMYSEHA